MLRGVWCIVMGLQVVESSGCTGYIMTLSLFSWKQFEAFWGSVWVILLVKDHLHKNWFIECEYCKCHIKSISEGNVLIFGINKVMILFFVVRNSHRFSFVFWATIGLARKFLPNVNQFFESLYLLLYMCLHAKVRRR